MANIIEKKICWEIATSTKLLIKVYYSIMQLVYIVALFNNFDWQ